MNLTPSTFDGLSLTASPFTAKFPNDQNGLFKQTPARAEFAQRAKTFPKLTNVSGQVSYLSLFVDVETAGGSVTTHLSTLKQYFDATDNSGTEQTLVAIDEDNANKQYQVSAIVAGFDWVYPVAQITLAVADQVWKSVDQNTDSWGLTATGGTNLINIPTNKMTLPTYEITPTGARSGTGQGFKRFVKVVNPNTDFGLGEHAWNLANSEASNGLDTATIIAAGNMQSDGSDLWVFVDGKKVNRWLQDIDTASTEIWIRLRLKRGITLTLGTAIAGTGAITTMDFERTPANEEAFSRLPDSSQVQIGSEKFTWSGKNASRLRLTGVTRSVFGSSAGAHSVADTVTWIQHQIWLVYGDSAAIAPNTPDADDLKPMFDLTSENDRLNFSNFATLAGSRADEWKSSLSLRKPVGRAMMSSPNDVTLYTDQAGTVNAVPKWTDPVNYMGGAIASVLDGAEYVRTAAELWWKFSHKCGMGTVTATGMKYVGGTADWINHVEMLYSADGENWNVQCSEAVPAADATWENLSTSGSAQAFGGIYNHVALFMRGGVPGGSSQHRVMIEYSSVEVKLDSTQVPTVAIGSEISGQYEFKNAELANNTTGKSIYIRNLVMDIDDTLVIDCENRKVYLNSDPATPLREVLFTDDIRGDWLALQPGDNTLQWNDTGTGNVTVATKYYDRANC